MNRAHPSLSFKSFETNQIRNDLKIRPLIVLRNVAREQQCS